MLHQHLERQLRRLGLAEDTLPSAENWREFLGWISSIYAAMDRERYLVEHSLEVLSKEMQELTAKIVEERDKFAGIFQATASGLAILNPEGFLVEANPAILHLLGYTHEEIRSQHVRQFIDPADLAPILDKITGLATAQTSQTRGLRRLRTKTGETVLTEIQATAILAPDGRTKLIVTLIEDVTERTRLEVELRHSQKLESVGRLAAGIAHEINTPIQFIGDNVKFLATSFDQLFVLGEAYRGLIRQATAGALTAADLERLRRAEEIADLDYLRENIPTALASTNDGVDRVARIVQSMKAFAHPDRGERSLADLNTALRNTLTIATNELKYIADLETELGDIPLVPCVLSDLNQVFLNLLVNAAHAIGDVVGDSGRRGTIRVRTYAQDQKVVVAISDTGTGIPEAVRGKIFDPFFTTKGVGKGTGQGLALAHSVIVDQHAGKITFDTEVGKGTTFYVSIPATSAGSPSAKSA